MCLGHSAEIISLKIAEPYPLLISASADGTVCVWPLKACKEYHANINNCILRILNSVWTKEKEEKRIPITGIEVVAGMMAGLTKTFNEKGIEEEEEEGGGETIYTFLGSQEYNEFI